MYIFKWYKIFYKTILTKVVPVCSSPSEACRICYEPASLVSVCDCKGSVRYIHPHCLVQWISVSGRTTCEICHAKYRFINREIDEIDENDLCELSLCVGTGMFVALLLAWIGFQIVTNLHLF